MRDAVESVARLFPTAIISGRGREKVEGFVQLRELYYAGSHGMDIIGPRVSVQLAESNHAESNHSIRDDMARTPCPGAKLVQ